MPPDLSKSQIDRLGLRLVRDSDRTDEDLELLQQLLLDRSRQLDRAEARVRDELGIVPTSRVKNTETILEKLRRGDGSGLKSVQDLAGMRIVGDFDRRGQDELVERIVALFGDGERAPKVVDRRAEPMHGYRAVHVIVFPESAPIEIQVRTAWQHEWAEFFEKLADHVGRGIRYGEPPDPGWDPDPAAQSVFLEWVASRRRARESVVKWALKTADFIGWVEVVATIEPDDPSLGDDYEKIDGHLADLRQMLARMAVADERQSRLLGRLND
jgi:hypothetical protein